MKSQPAIEICNIKKHFIIPKYNNNSLKQAIVNGFQKNEKQVYQVLNGINVTINKGDFFGIVGRNGSGKSTLLKIICGVYVPDDGEVKLHGKITPFIELGVGFNPELSGRDNVFLNGALLGFTRKQMAEMYDEIVEFAELEEFMDLKLKNYSSGMQVRLAFSIAIKAKNDILIFDEVLAVGDEAFQRKCINVFEEYRAKGQTVVLVTHDMGSVKRFCNRAVMIEDGKIVESGAPDKVATRYSVANGLIPQEATSESAEEAAIKLVATNIKHQPQQSFTTYDDAILDLQWLKHREVKAISIGVLASNGNLVTGFELTQNEATKLKIDLAKMNHIKVKLSLSLAPGQYYFKVDLKNAKQQTLWSKTELAKITVVAGQDGLDFAGYMPIKRQWLTK